MGFRRFRLFPFDNTRTRFFGWYGLVMGSLFLMFSPFVAHFDAYLPDDAPINLHGAAIAMAGMGIVSIVLGLVNLRDWWNARFPFRHVLSILCFLCGCLFGISLIPPEFPWTRFFFVPLGALYVAAGVFYTTAPPKPIHDKPRHCRARILWPTALVIVGLVCFSLLSVFLMQPAPFDYTLSPPDSDGRRALIRQLSVSLQELEEEDKRFSGPPSQSWTNDPDRLWPKDRFRLVIAVQRFALDRNALPSSMADLVQHGYINSGDLETTFTLSSSGGAWEITLADYLVAHGN